jgi:hypothetical protein
MFIKKLLFKMSKKLVIGFVLDLLKTDDFRKKWVAKINKSIDLKNLTEKEEEVHFTNVYEAIRETLDEGYR